MSDPTSFVPFAVLSASLLGSAHCAGMCGGLALSQSGDVRSVASYHGGRLAGYLVLGALAGALGERVFSPQAATWASLGASIVMATLFFTLAVRAWTGRAPHLQWLPARWMPKLFRNRGPLATGVLTAALPCGWLQGFVISSVATRSAAAGAFFLFCFWIGTLPALAAGPAIARRWLLPGAAKAPRLVALLLVIAGLGSLGLRLDHSGLFSPHADGVPTHSCGHSAE